MQVPPAPVYLMAQVPRDMSLYFRAHLCSLCDSPSLQSMAVLSRQSPAPHNRAHPRILIDP